MLSLQNGLNELIIQRIVGRDRTIGAFVNFGADWMAPGEIMFGNRGAVVLGELDGAMTPRLEALHAVMRDFEPDADHHADHLVVSLGQARLWRDAVRPGARPEGHRRLPGAAGIAAAVAPPRRGGDRRGAGRRRGAARLQRLRYRRVPPGRQRGRRTQSVAAMVAFNRTSAKTHSGVWRDLAVRKRRTEVDVQIAPIAEIGARHGIDCRATRKLVEMIHEVEEGRRPMTDDNLLGTGEGQLNAAIAPSPAAGSRKPATASWRELSVRHRRKSWRWPTPGTASPRAGDRPPDPAARRRLRHGRLRPARTRRRLGATLHVIGARPPAIRSPARSDPARRCACSPAAWCPRAPTPSCCRRTQPPPATEVRVNEAVRRRPPHPPCRSGFRRRRRRGARRPPPHRPRHRAGRRRQPPVAHRAPATAHRDPRDRRRDRDAGRTDPHRRHRQFQLPRSGRPGARRRRRAGRAADRRRHARGRRRGGRRGARHGHAGHHRRRLGGRPRSGDRKPEDPRNEAGFLADRHAARESRCCSAGSAPCRCSACRAIRSRRWSARSCSCCPR